MNNTLAKTGAVDSFFDRIFNQDWPNAVVDTVPSNRMYTSEDGDAVLEIALPGLERDDVTVAADEEKMEIEVKEGRASPFTQEGKYVKSMRGLDPESVEAKMERGILEIKISPRSKRTRKQIEIK